MPEEWGGKTVTVEVSAKKKQNIDLLLEMILLVSDIGELKANPKRNATGTVLEAKLDKGRGPVATVLVQDGTLHVGDTFIAGPIVGRVRALIDDRGRPTKSAGPSTPVEVLGLTGLPQPGDVVPGRRRRRRRGRSPTFREEQAKNRALGAKGGRLTLESLQAQIAEGGMKELPIIIKADVQGSAEVLADTLTKLADEKVKIRIIHSGATTLSSAMSTPSSIVGEQNRTGSAPSRNSSSRSVRSVVGHLGGVLPGLEPLAVRRRRRGRSSTKNGFVRPPSVGRRGARGSGRGTPACRRRRRQRIASAASW